MPSLSDLNLSPSVLEVLTPLVGDKQVGTREESVWIEKGRIRMELEDLGEGWNGDYDEEDPDDTPLLRFSFYAINPDGDEDQPDRVRYDQLDDCSYCTAIDARAPWEVQMAAACTIFDEVFDRFSVDADPPSEIDPAMGGDARRVCERMSHTSSGDFPALSAAIEATQIDEASAPANGAPARPRF